MASKHKTKRVFVPVDDEALALLDELAPLMRSNKAQILAGLVVESKPALRALLAAIKSAKSGDNAQATNLLNAALLDGLGHAVDTRRRVLGGSDD